MIRRGDLFWFVDAATGGALPGIPHPHVVVSDDVLNRSRLPTVTVCALTSNRRRANEPGNLLLDPGEGGLTRPSVVVVSQLATAPKDALREPIGRLSDDRVAQILAGLRFQQASYDRGTSGRIRDRAPERGGENGAAVRYLMIPGIDGSGPEHWQTPWERELGGAAARIAPRSWVEPDEADWLGAVARGVDALAGVRDRAADRVVLVAHSLGCVAAAAYLDGGSADARIAGAFLVAPPDLDAPSVPGPAASFSLPTGRLPVPGLVVASQDDPYCTPDRAASMAAGWGTPVIDVGALGHVNAESGLGDWPAGRRLLTAFVAGLGD